MPRLLSLIILTLAAFVALFFIAPQQLPVVLYKATLVAFAALLGYWVDRLLFPYARPDGYLVFDWRNTRKWLKPFGEDGSPDYRIIPGLEQSFNAATIRRALIVIAVVIGVAQGL